ncbi:MAG: hypothetical protein SPI83_00800 [Rothia sp. (in: high G+C Gram-positive bacteria)]|nr:hypothetical protein [Rothia sp. (in: high G+C Gram-positive bacteria)]
MKRLGPSLSSALRAPSRRAGVLTLCVSATLALAACTSPNNSSENPSTTANAVATNSAGETLTENFVGSEALAQASDVALDAPEVENAEQLYTDIQEALAGIEPASTLASTEDTSDEISSDTENVHIDEDAVESYISAETTAQLEAAATGAALDQYLATATEYALAGWHVEGNSTVVGTPRVADSDYQGQAAKVLEVCLDSSQVKVLDENGNPVSDSQFTRSLNIFTLVEDNGAWKIASHDFPNDADC